MLSNSADLGDDDQRMRMIAASKMLANATAAMVEAAKVHFRFVFILIILYKPYVFFSRLY